MKQSNKPEMLWNGENEITQMQTNQLVIADTG